MFCGDHLLAAKLRRGNIDASAGAVEEIARIVAHIRERWPRVRILMRADSGFASEELMAWCEANKVDYLFGLARNAREDVAASPTLAEAAARFMSEYGVHLAERSSAEYQRLFDSNYPPPPPWSC